MIGMCGTGGYEMHYGAYYALALFLLSLGMGCKVCAKSEKIECSCGKKITMFVGWFIMIFSVLSMACLGFRCWKHCHDKKTCPMGHEMMQDSDDETPAEVVPGK